MKRLIALTLSLALLVILSVVPVSAAETLEIGTITNPEAGGVYTFTVPFIVSTGVDQVTLLATRGAGATAPTTMDNTTIVAIDQVAASTGSITFAVDKTKFDAETYPNIYIKLGGTAIDSAVSNDPIVLAEAATTFKVFGYVELPQVNGVGSVLATVELEPGTTTTTDNTGYFVFNDVADKTYDLKISAKSALTRTLLGITVAGADNEVSTSELKTKLMFGDVDNDGIIDYFDYIKIINNYNKGSSDLGYTSEYDLDSDGVIDYFDYIKIINNYNKLKSDY